MWVPPADPGVGITIGKRRKISSRTEAVQFIQVIHVESDQVIAVHTVDPVVFGVARVGEIFLEPNREVWIEHIRRSTTISGKYTWVYATYYVLHGLGISISVARIVPGPH